MEHSGGGLERPEPVRVLVTGGTGFIGQHVVQALVERGYAVRVLARPTADIAFLEALGVEVFTGDILDDTSCLAAARDCEGVFHLAADYRLWVCNPEEMERTNVGGTRNVLRAAGACGVKRVVYTSSVVTLQPSSTDPEPRPARLEMLATPYERSKWRAEREVEAMARAGLPVVTVYPTMPIGPCDRRPTAGGQMIVDFMRGRLPFYVDFRVNVVAVQDVAIGHVLAFEKGRVGEGYILGHKNVTLGELLQTLAKLTGCKAPRAKIPLGLAWLAALADDCVGSRLGRRPPRVSVGSVHMARRNLWVNCEKAAKELGLPQSPIEAALQQAVAWFQEHGYAP